MQPHINYSVPNQAAVTRVVCSIKDPATQDLFQPAGAIVESAMLSNNITAMPCPALPKPDNLQRTANNKKLLSLNWPCITSPEKYLHGNISVGLRRHLLLVTADQLDKLAIARRWYIDGTFHVEWKRNAGATGVCVNERQEENKLTKLSSKCC